MKLKACFSLMLCFCAGCPIPGIHGYPPGSITRYAFASNCENGVGGWLDLDPHPEAKQRVRLRTDFGEGYVDASFLPPSRSHHFGFVKLDIQDRVCFVSESSGGVTEMACYSESGNNDCTVRLARQPLIPRAADGTADEEKLSPGHWYGLYPVELYSASLEEVEGIWQRRFDEAKQR